MREIVERRLAPRFSEAVPVRIAQKDLDATIFGLPEVARWKSRRRWRQGAKESMQSPRIEMQE